MTGIGSFSNPWDLATAFSAPQLVAGRRLNLRGGTYSNDFLISFSDGENGNLITIQPFGQENPLIDGSITTAPDYLLLRNLHIRDADFTDRTTLESGSNPSDIPLHNAVQVNASHIELRDCVIENSRQGIYKNSTTLNLTIDGCIVFHNGWDAPDRPHGHGCYLTGQFGTVKNSIFFSNFEFGIKIYDEGVVRPAIDDFTVEDNICFNNSVLAGQVGTRGDILFGHNNLNFNRPIVRRNYTYQLAEYMIPDVGGKSNTNHIGYNKAFYDAVVTDNYFPNGLVILDSEEWGSTFLDYQNNVTAPEETNRVFVIPVRARAHVAVYNWELLDSVIVDVSGVFSVGDSINVINVQDYFMDIQELTVAGDGTITINMQAENRTVAAPVAWTAPATTFPRFGAFVLERVDV